MHFCPDLAYLVGILSRFCRKPRLVHVELVMHVIQYVSGTLQLGLTFDGEADILNDVIGYIDSNFAKLKLDRKSTEGYLFMLAKAAINHLSKFQSIVALSTKETEYVAMCEEKREAVWLGYMLAKLGF